MSRDAVCTMIRRMDRRIFLRALALTWAATLTAAGCTRKSLPKVDRDGAILAFGDSLTFGTGATPGESYPAVLGRLIARRVVGDGVPGDTTAGGLTRLTGALDENKPQLLILCMGGNDLLQRLDEATTITNLRAMIKLATDRGISVVLLAPPRPALMSAAPGYYDKLAKEFRIPLETEVLPRVLSDRALKSDLVHPNAQGYAQVAVAVAKLLKDARAL